MCLFCQGFFDIHPPLGKLILAYGGYLLGYRPDPHFVIHKIGDLYPKHVKFLLVRLVSAFFSIGTVPMTYLIARQLRMSQIAAFLPAAAVLFDFLGIIEGRLILMDSQLLFFCQLSLSCALDLWRTPERNFRRLLKLIFTGMAAGAALSIKHTALATPGLIAIVSFFGIHFIDSPMPIRDCVLAALSGLAVYTVPFYILFHTLWLSGGKYDNFMPLHFRKTLINNPEYDPSAKRASFLRLFLYLNGRMVQSNASIKKRHVWESTWYQWIVDWRGLLYFLFKEKKDGKQLRTQIYLLGNPVVIYMVLLSVIFFCGMSCAAVRYRQIASKALPLRKFRRTKGLGTFLLFGWLCNLIPYVLVDRAAFIYHYLPGLFYGELLCGLLVDLLPSRLRALSVCILVTLMGAALIYWSPWVYAFALPLEKHAQRRWLPRWT